MQTHSTTLVWLRQDLRLSDHPALSEASKRGLVIPVFIWDPDGDGAWAPGAASKWWLHHSLIDLDVCLRKIGSRLILRCGDSLTELRALIHKTGATALHFSRRYEPLAASRDHAVELALRDDGIGVEIFGSALLWEPEAIRTQSGGSYQVFTPFWKALQNTPKPLPPLPAIRKLMLPKTWPESANISALDLLPRIAWTTAMQGAWQPGLSGARTLLTNHLPEVLPHYLDTRDLPDRDGTSRLSPHLHFGEIGAREVWAAAGGYGGNLDDSHGAESSRTGWQRQLAWREFAHHLLARFPSTPELPLRNAFTAFPWSEDSDSLRAWQRGLTGYPYVDAGMRQLWATGWMHNRVRMVAGSFLVKHLLQPWQGGARWFWDTLVDADLAQNTLGWQWVAGCGADAAPYFRIFNPVAQGERFDPVGAYVKRWVPELTHLSPKWIHRPWEAPEGVLQESGVNLGKNYPRPIVSHAKARILALAAYGAMREAAPNHFREV